jgi:quinol monooxygenase YgiN
LSQIAMVIKTTVKDGKREEVLELYKQHLAPRAQTNDEQQVVAWCADQHDPNVFYLFEVYSSPEAMGANAQADWFGQYMAAVGPLLAGEPEVGMAEPMWTEGL